MPPKQQGASMTDAIQTIIRETIRSEIGDLRAFVDRRIAELSMEVHATVDLMDFSENNLSGQLASIKEQIGSIVAQPSNATRNSGLELEAVIQATESAANRIMEAAEAISDWLREGNNDPASLQAVSDRVSAIFEACSFQDVTGQRIRRAIQHLEEVETMLTGLVPAGAEPLRAVEEVNDAELGQDAVDSLFG